MHILQKASIAAVFKEIAPKTAILIQVEFLLSIRNSYKIREDFFKKDIHICSLFRCEKGNAYMMRKDSGSWEAGGKKDKGREEQNLSWQVTT